MDRSRSSDKSGSRNALAARFHGDWIWYSDTDHRFDPDTVHRMVSLLYQADVDVITGVYRLKEHPYLPVLYHFDEASGKYSYINDMDWDAPLVEIASAGAGCLLVRRRVFARIESELHEKPFDEIHPYSEDFSFYARCRRLGIKVFCAPQVCSNHLMIKEITHDDYDRNAVITQSSK
jgi:GT2 family glycosyltransferase